MKISSLKTKTGSSLKSLVAAALLASAPIASASIIASDNFESYTNGPIAGQNGGTGWTGAWTETAVGNPSKNVVDTSSSPLVYVIPGGATIDGATRAVEIQMPGTTTQGFLQRQLASPLSQTYYAGYLLRYVGSGTWAGGNNTFSLHLGINSSSTSTLNFGIRGNGTGGTNDEFLVRVGTGAAVAGASTGGQLTNGTTYYLVCEYTWGGSGFTSAKMWLNPTFNDITDTPGGDASLTFASPIAATTHVFWRAIAWEVDDIVRADQLILGTTWLDVVPPSGPALAGVGVSTSPSNYTPVSAQTLTAGQSITNYAVELDGSGNYVANIPAFWSPINVTNGISGNDIVAVNNGRSAVFTAHLAGTANLRATPVTGATNYQDSGLITVVIGPASTVRVETAANGSGTVLAAQTLAPGATVTGYSIVRDVGGNFLTNDVATWSLANVIGGIVSGDLAPAGDNKSATFTGQLSGTANISATSGVLTAVPSGQIKVTHSITWVGNGVNNLWNFVTTNWIYGSALTNYTDMDTLTFNSSGSQSPAVNIVSTVRPNSIDVVSGAYTFGGAGGIAGVCAVTNESGNNLVFLTANTYSGPTCVNGYGSTLQLGNGGTNGSLGSGPVYVLTGDRSLIFNRNDPTSAPYVASNYFAGSGSVSGDFTLDFMSGATELKGTAANYKAKAIVRSGATLILSCAGTDLGASTQLGGPGYDATNLWVESGGTCKLGVPNASGDHITAAGRWIRVDGTFDANGQNEAFGVLVGSGILDNTGTNNAVLTVNQGSSDANGGIGNGGEIYSWPGLIRNSGAYLLGITKDGSNTMVLNNTNTYGGDTRVINGGILELGYSESMKNSTYDQQSGDTGNLSFGSLTSATLGGLKSGANKTLSLQNSSAAAVALTIGGNGQTNTYAGNLSGSGSLTKTGTGIQTLSGTNTYSGATTVSQGTLLVNGIVGGSGVTVAAAGTLGGTGTISPAVSVSGTLRPGNNGVGRLTASSSVTLSGSTVMELNRAATPTNDQLAASSVILGGTLTVTNLGGTLQTGDTFVLFTGSLSSTFSSVTLPSLPGGLSWNSSALTTAGTISITGTAVPLVISSVSGAGGNLTLSGSGGTPGATYYVISTNNLVAPRSTWPVVATNAFALDGKFTNSIPINPAASQSYYTIRQ